MTEKVMTLQSATGISSPIMIECRDGVVHFTTWSTAESTRAWANPNRADVLAALGAVDKADVVAAERAADELQAKLAEAEAKLAQVQGSADAWWKEFSDAETERARLQGIIDTVKALLENADADDLKIKFYNKLQRALKQQPELPTEPGSIVIATEVAGQRGEWVMMNADDNQWWSAVKISARNGWLYDSSDITEWHPAKVVEA